MLVAENKTVSRCKLFVVYKSPLMYVKYYIAFFPMYSAGFKVLTPGAGTIFLPLQFGYPALWCVPRTPLPR